MNLQPALALVPDLPRFNTANFDLFARLRGYSFRVGRPQSAVNGVRSFDGFNYVLTTENDQGMPWTTGDSRLLNQMIAAEPRMFHLLNVYPLPNGDSASLYAIRREGG